MPTTRQPIEDPPAQPGARPTANKDYWLFWERLARQLSADGDAIRQGEQAIADLNTELGQLENTVAHLVVSGTHAARLAIPVSAPPIYALWMETDRSNVIYQLQPSGAPTWVYVAGTMWGTLVPDQRPTDLGARDAGFDFRSTDSPAREFIWSGAAWVDATAVLGAPGLTHPNVVTKVGSAGQIVEGGITDESAANSDRLHITADGKVGIGTNAPAELLHVSNPTGNASIKLTAAGTTSPYHQYERGAQQWWTGPGLEGNANFAIYNPTAARFMLMLDTSGAVRLFLGGGLKTLSVDGSGFVKAT